MIDCFLGDALWVLSCPFWSTVLRCGARLPIHTLNYWTASGVNAALRLHIGPPVCPLGAEPRRTAGLLFTCQYLCRMILVTPHSMMWDWLVSKEGPIPFYWPSCSLSFCLLLFPLSLLSFFGLVLWGWGLQTDRVLIALPAMHYKSFIIIIIAIIIIKGSKNINTYTNSLL